MPNAPQDNVDVVRPRAERAPAPANLTVAVGRLFDGASVLGHATVVAISKSLESKLSFERNPLIARDSHGGITARKWFMLEQLPKACEACRASALQDLHECVEFGGSV